MPEWFPEYDLDLGPPVDAPPSDIAALLAADGVSFQRRYTRGQVVVNPTDHATAFPLDGVYQRAVPTGGGPVAADGTPSGSLAYVAVDSVALAPHSAAILLNQTPR